MSALGALTASMTGIPIVTGINVSGPSATASLALASSFLPYNTGERKWRNWQTRQT